MRYKYCPECGLKLIEKPAGDDGKVPYCENCRRYWFDAFSSCVIVLVYNEFGEVVLSRQGYLSNQYATFTSGYINPGETAEETAIREVKEELGITIHNPEYSGTYWFEEHEMLMHGFLAYSPKCDLVLSQEVDSAEWVTADAVPLFIFPDSPGNAAFAIYRNYMKNKRFNIKKNYGD